MKFGTLIRITDIMKSAEQFERLRAAGFEACQLVYKPKCYYATDAEIIKAAAEASGIEISAFFAGYRDNYTSWDIYYDYKNAGLNSKAFMESRLNYLFEAAGFVKSLGVTDMVIHAGFIPNDPFAPEYTGLLSTVHLLVKRCSQCGVNLLLETGGESPITLLRFIKDLGADNLFINFDTGNIIMYGYGNPVDAIKTFGKYIRNVHAKDGLPPTDPRKIGEEVRLGEGDVDFYEIFKRLNKTGYDRYVIIEREIEGEKQTADVLHALDYIKKIIGRL